ncbi:MAG: site-2 protease family protein [Thermoprotei archaeon]
MSENIVNEVKNRFNVESVYVENNVLRFSISPTPNLDKQFKELVEALRKINYIAILKSDAKSLRIDIAPYVWPSSSLWKRDLIITLISLGATLSTIFYAGLLLSKYERSTALLYTFAMILIIGLHEMGHFIAGRAMGVKVSTPIFIPGLPQIGGTFGAVIRLREPIIDSKSLLIVGFSGPLVSFILSTIIAYIGLSWSQLAPSQQVQGVFLPSSLLLYALGYLIFGSVPQNYIIVLHPVAFAGYIGLLITALNLTPIGQLDGGHVFRAFLTRRSFRIVSLVFIFLLLIIGYWGMAIIALFIMENPGALNDVSKPHGIELLILVFAVIIWVLSIAIMI